jgi:hypothetical protein
MSLSRSDTALHLLGIKPVGWNPVDAIGRLYDTITNLKATNLDLPIEWARKSWSPYSWNRSSTSHVSVGVTGDRLLNLIRSKPSGPQIVRNTTRSRASDDLAASVISKVDL